MLIVNAGHPEGSEELERVLSASVASAFPNVARDPIADAPTRCWSPPRARSPLSACSPPPRACRTTCVRWPPRPRRLAARLRGGEVYTDDRAPVEWLIDKSIIEYAAGGRAAD